VKRPWGKLLALSIGLFLFLWIFRQVGLEETLAEVRQVGWSFPFLLLPSGVMALLFSIGWWLTLAPGVPLAQTFLMRAAGEAVNLITPTGYLGGEPLKASLLRRFGIPLTDGLASVVVTKTMTTFAFCLFIFLGLACALPRTREFNSAFLGGLGVGLFLALSVLALYYGQTRGMFSWLHRLIYRLGARGEAWMARREGLEVLDGKIATLYGARRPLAWCLLFSLLGWLTSAIEAYFFLWAMGSRVDASTAMMIQALLLGVKGATFFIPANLGAQEGGTVLIFISLGMSAETATAFSLLRRSREILWVGIGLLVLARTGWPAFAGQAAGERGS
jgi:putative membrane protein